MTERTIFAASTGGHLAQLHSLSRRMSEFDGTSPLWVTFDTPQSRSLLADHDVLYLPYTGPRDGFRAATNTIRAWRILRNEPVAAVVSTGAAIALSIMVPAASHRIPCFYIESAARSEGPSLSGKMARTIPGIKTFCQYPSWASAKWQYRGSVFDAYSAGAPVPAPAAPRVLVTLGTIPFPFDRLVERLERILPKSWNVEWQLGTTTRRPAFGRSHGMLPSHELRALIADADVVVSHAGIGSALAVLDAGKTPVLIPREKIAGEHVDDHQRQIAAELSRRGLAVTAEAGHLTAEHLIDALGRSVLISTETSPVILNGAPVSSGA